MSQPARFAPFQWADYFETGFGEVDGQHHKLVDLVNALAQRAAGGADIKPGELAHVLDGLARYAVHHFATEEALMTQAGIDARHLDGHRHARCQGLRRRADHDADLGEERLGRADVVGYQPVLRRGQPGGAGLGQALLDDSLIAQA